MRTNRTSSASRTEELQEWEVLAEHRARKRDLEWALTCRLQVVISTLLEFTLIRPSDLSLGTSRAKRDLSGWTCLNRFQITTVSRRRVNCPARRADLLTDNPVLFSQRQTQARAVVSTVMTWSSKVCSCRDNSSNSLRQGIRIRRWDADSQDPPQLTTSLANIIELTVHFANQFWL